MEVAPTGRWRKQEIRQGEIRRGNKGWLGSVEFLDGVSVIRINSKGIVTINEGLIGMSGRFGSESLPVSGGIARLQHWIGTGPAAVWREISGLSLLESLVNLSEHRSV